MTATLFGGAAAAIWLYLLVWRGGFWRVRTRDRTVPAMPPPRSVVAVIPARDEAPCIGHAVASLLVQRYPGPFHVVVVDDHSSDSTAAIAARAAAALGRSGALTIVSAPPMPPGWTGKLWAVRQGVATARTMNPDFLLLSDADIVHPPGNLADLVARAEAGGFALVSLMVRLHCRHLWERLLIPAFVFFFFQIYPPRWVADPARRTAAAAGGCMLLRPAALERIGGIDSIRHEIIDDCALARRIKEIGPIWLAAAQPLPDGVARSIREYRTPRPIWNMITRCAFAQLLYSGTVLAATVIAMAVIYLAPPLLVLCAGSPGRWLGGAAWLVMTAAFLPVLRDYRCPLVLAPLLPAIAVFYLAATIGSAVQYWRGRGGNWKGRFQAARVS